MTTSVYKNMIYRKLIEDKHVVKDIQLHSIKKKCILSENVTFH